MAYSQKSGFEELLYRNKVIKGEESTHTRIPDKDLNLYGGNYNIPLEDYDDFLQKYYKSVFL